MTLSRSLPLPLPLPLSLIVQVGTCDLTLVGHSDGGGINVARTLSPPVPYGRQYGDEIGGSLRIRQPTFGCSEPRIPSKLCGWGGTCDPPLVGHGDGGGINVEQTLPFHQLSEWEHIVVFETPHV